MWLMIGKGKPQEQEKGKVNVKFNYYKEKERMKNNPSSVRLFVCNLGLSGFIVALATQALCLSTPSYITPCMTLSKSKQKI